MVLTKTKMYTINTTITKYMLQLETISTNGEWTRLAKTMKTTEALNMNTSIPDSNTSLKL